MARVSFSFKKNGAPDVVFVLKKKQMMRQNGVCINPLSWKPRTKLLERNHSYLAFFQRSFGSTDIKCPIIEIREKGVLSKMRIIRRKEEQERLPFVYIFDKNTIF